MSKSTFNSVSDYISSLSAQRRGIVSKIRKVVNNNLPTGFEECINYGMIGWVVPHSIFEEGYHCDPSLPLPFMNLASQKNYVALYHMGVYSDPKLLKWFTEEYAKVVSSKLDMGKSCIRFKKMDEIPYELIGELVGKISVKEWISFYENRGN